MGSAWLKQKEKREREREKKKKEREKNAFLAEDEADASTRRYGGAHTCSYTNKHRNALGHACVLENTLNAPELDVEQRGYVYTK